MKRLILMLAAFFTFSTALVSCRETDRDPDEVEMETTMDDEIETETDLDDNDLDNDLNGTTRGGNMEDDNTTTTGTDPQL